MIILAAILTLALVACGDQSSGDPSSPGGTSGTVTDNSLTAQLTWLDANAQSNSSYTLIAYKDETLNHVHDLSYDGKSNITITLKGNGAMRTISLLYMFYMFYVDTGVTLILDSNITLKGQTNWTTLSPVIIVANGGTLIMNSGTVITGGSRGASLNGTFTMNGGTITGNEASGQSGVGVFVGAGNFTMNGGAITKNNGALGSASFNLGGGVCVDTGTFTMNGGEISGNSIGYNGGGVYVNTGTFTLNDGSIIDNNGGIDGGGVYVSRNYGTFTMKGGTISHNTAIYEGGGVYMDNLGSTIGTFTKTGGTITGYGDDTVNGNRAGSGHAAYAGYNRRDNTAGPSVNMDSRVDGSAGGWE